MAARTSSKPTGSACCIATKAGYRPEAMGEVFEMFKRGESFELDRARAEGRQPRIYHGLFSSHPTPDSRA
jgi:predicted Zn-dependent protease